MSKLYDALIIGAGPAGLQAALGLGRLHRTCAIFSNSQYRNAGVHAAHAILTRDGVDPEELRRLGRADIEKYGHADFIETKISKVWKEGALAETSYESFTVEDDKGRTWHGRTVVVASGIQDKFPDLAGYAENWPKNIYQCLFCDGHERWKLKKGILAYPSLAAQPHALMMATMAHFQSLEPGAGRLPALPPKESSVSVFSNGPANPDGNPQIAQGLEQAAAHGISIDERKVTKLVADPKEGVWVHLDDASSVHLGFVFHKPDSVLSKASEAIVSQLGLETVETPFGPNLKLTPPMNGTGVPGVFAAGDIATGMPNVTVAMASGMICASGIAKYCNDLDDGVALRAWRKHGSDNKINPS